MADGTGDMFLMVKGAKSGRIKGESQDSAHPGDIEVLSWSWGMEGKPSFGGGAASGKATIGDLRIVKKVDSASTPLMSALRTNEMVQAVLTLRKAGKTPLEFLKITIEQGRVMTLTLDAGDPAGSSKTIERVSFSFNKISVEYVPQGSDGQPQGSMTFVDQWGT